MVLSFLYRGFSALLGALVRRRCGLGVKDIELIVLRDEVEVLRRYVDFVLVGYAADRLGSPGSNRSPGAAGLRISGSLRSCHLGLLRTR